MPMWSRTLKVAERKRTEGEISSSAALKTHVQFAPTFFVICPAGGCWQAVYRSS